MRAPLFKGKRNEFVKVLVDFIKAEKFKETICLTSSHAFERLDSQIEGEHSFLPINVPEDPVFSTRYYLCFLIFIFDGSTWY
jgi:hypothetical protein